MGRVVLAKEARRMVVYLRPAMSESSDDAPKSRALASAMPTGSTEDDLHLPELDEQVRVTVSRSVLTVVSRRSNRPEHAHPRGHNPERGVVRRDLGRVLPAEEELAAVGVGAGVRHGNGARRVGGTSQVLVLEHVAGTARAGSRRISALQDVDPDFGESVAVRTGEVPV